ncbi:hypothetical protein Hgul01_05138 [Herpetosiphon gulosus]|uniref:Uncharacterized protein n=1 Tax=Herpetosiphon gulosus TaxID=1973496 RepID=A0ABP9X8Z6_9CHLR
MIIGRLRRHQIRKLRIVIRALDIQIIGGIVHHPKGIGVDRLAIGIIDIAGLAEFIGSGPQLGPYIVKRRRDFQALNARGHHAGLEIAHGFVTIVGRGGQGALALLRFRPRRTATLIFGSLIGRFRMIFLEINIAKTIAAHPLNGL